MRRTLFAAAWLTAAFTAHATPMRATANFTGPLVTPNPSNLPAGMFNVEPYLVYQESRAYYDHQGKRHRSAHAAEQWQWLLPMTAGLTDRLQAQLTLGAVRAHAGRDSSDGLRSADTSLNFQYLVQKSADDGQRPAIAVNYAHRFPTGRHDRLGSNLLNGTSQGANLNTLAVLAQQVIWLNNGRPLRWRARLQYGQAASRVLVDGASVHGTEVGFRGFADIGRQIGASAALEYSISERWVAVMEATYEHRAGGRVWGTMPNTSTPIDRRTHAGSLYTLAPAVEYHLNSRFGFIGGVQFSVAGRNSAAFAAPQLAFNMVL